MLTLSPGPNCSKGAAAPGFAREAQCVLLAILAVKFAFLLLDPMPRFFLWDSVTFLNGALFGDLPWSQHFCTLSNLLT